MVNTFFFKCLLFSFFLFSVSETETKHPIYMSVTEIEHNAKEKSIEISCKIFTNDFEKTLRANYKTKIDLLDAKQNKAMGKYVSDYVQKHLKLSVDGKVVTLKYIGFENIEDGIVTYLEVENIASLKKIEVTNNILYDYKPAQISVIHASVNGKRQSTKLTNPEAKAVFTF